MLRSTSLTLAGLLLLSPSTAAAPQKIRKVPKSPCFATDYPSTRLLGRFAKDVVLEDLDGDGDLDVAAREEDDVRTWLRDLRGDYREGQVLPMTASSFGSGDLDGDGDVDLLVVQPGTIQVLENDGTGHLVAGASSTGPFESQELALGDLDGDGDLDAVLRLGSFSGETMQVYLNDGGGAFAAGASYTGTGLRRAPVLGDVDGDGDLDLTSGGAGMTEIRANVGDGTFVPFATLAADGVFTRYADLDGDGDLDLFQRGNTSGTLRVLLNLGGGSFSGPSFYGPSSNYLSLATGDMDGDGDVDLMAADRARVILLFNQGNGTMVVGPQLAAGFDTRSVRTADLDGDGDLDLVCANDEGNGITLLENLGGGVFDNPDEHVLTDHAQDLVGGDVDADGDIDLVATTRTSLVLLSNQGARTFVQSSTPSSRRDELLLADLDGDGDPDLASIRPFPAEVLEWMRNDGSGAFGAAESVGTPGFRYFTHADLDGDAQVELIATSISTDTLSVFEYDGAGFSTSVNYSVPDPLGVRTGDLNSDGLVDVVTLSPSQVHVLFNQGGGALALSLSLPLPSGWSFSDFDLADMDRDGDVDLVLAGTSGLENGVAVVLTNDGAGGLQPTSTLPIGPIVRKIRLADVDGDGNRDVLASCYNADSVYLARNLGVGVFAPTESFVAHASPGGILAADLDADGNVDVAVANDLGADAPVGRVTILYGRCP